MLNRYCFIVTCSQYYVLGLNSILNAVDYFGHTNIDFYIVHENTMQPYFDFVKDKFSFPVKEAKVEEWEDPTMLDDNGNIFRDMSHTWAEFHFIDSIKDEYDGICMLDADMLLLGNVMNYLKIAANTDLILIPHNIRCDIWTEDFKTFENPEVWARCYSLEHWIVFFSPKHNIDVINFVWNNRFNNLAIKDVEKREPQEELYLFSKALYKLNKMDKVLTLPGALWNGGDVSHTEHLSLMGVGDFGVKSIVGDRIYSIHSRWWNKYITKRMLEQVDASKEPEKYSRMRRNAEVGEAAINFFNRKCKVTIDDIRALDIPGFGGTLDSFENVLY